MSSLTFGPGWLRALSGGDTAEAQSKPAGMKRFKLAEFRYGREEMLALFVDNAKMPKELKDFGDIILQETLSEPLSFIPLTEEEERCQVAGVNSAVVLRMSGRGAPPVRGRGAIRGARGRGRGEGQPGYYRSLSNEDSGYNNSREPYARRPWAEGSRGGSSDRGAGRGDPSLGRGGFEPRARIPSDRAGSTEREPWRPGQEEDDGGGWRISGQRSWRKGSADASRNWRSDHSKEESGDPAIARRSWNRSNSEKEEGGNYWRHASTSSNSGLPEWCDDDDDQDLGTFDSSGQFKSLRDQKDAGQNHDKNADATDSRFSRQESDPPVFDSATDKDSEDWDGMEEAGKKQDGKTNRSSEMNDKSKINVSRDWDSGPPRGLTKEPDRGSSKERSRMSPREAGQGPHNGSDQREQNQRVDTASKTSPLPEAEDSKSVPISVSELEKQLLSGNDSGKKSVNTVNSNKIDDLTIDDVKSVAHDMRKILAESHMARTVPPGNDDEEADLDMDHIKNLIDKLDDENDDPFAMQVTSPMQEVANRNIDDPSIVFAKKAEPGVLIKGMQDWIYRDPQGEIQGPFSCEEMLQWFKAGYFTMGLLVRRVCDEIFLPLGDLIKLWNRVPFLPGREPPSVTSQVYAAQLARRQQQEQYLLAQQQRKMQQQQQQQHQQIQQQQQQHELRLLQQMQEQQQMKDMQQRPHNLNVGQEVSIWGDSPAPSPNLASTPWSPSTSQPEPQAWNDSKSPTANLEEFKKLEIDKERAEKLSGLELKKSSSEDLKRLVDEEEPAKGKPNEAEREPSDEYKGGLSPSDEELELADDDDSQLKEQNKKKSKGKKKKGANDKKKEEREKQQRREEEDRKALEALEKAQQEKIAIQKRKEEEERQKQILMQQQQLKQQQQQQILQQQQQQQQQQLKHQQMLMQQQAMMQQEQRRLNVNEGPSWNVPTSSNAPSLAEIQRMEEERQMIIREKLKQLQAHEQQIQQQQRAAAGWAEKGSKPVQSLRQIQEEEARQMLARQRNQVQHQQQPPKGGHGAVSSTVWNSKNVQSQQNYGGYDTQGGSASFWDDVMNLAPSLETSSQYQRSNSKSRVVSDSGFPSLNSGAKQNKKSKDEELVHRLFHQANPCDEFIQWVNKNMPGITKFVDVPTFVGFLQDIDSPYEVHEYIRSYFGENQDAQNFAREFLEWRKRNGRQPTSQYGPVSSSGMSIMSQNSDPAGLDGDDPTGRKKKQKKRMQKVNPSLLGFSCDADPGMVNRGAIQSAMDAWNSK